MLFLYVLKKNVYKHNLEKNKSTYSVYRLIIYYCVCVLISLTVIIAGWSSETKLNHDPLY